MGTHYVKARYLDASVIIKIFLEEPCSDVVREYFYAATSFCSTSLCVMESLGRIKAKWNNGHITEAQYYEYTGRLLTHVWSKQIEVAEVNLFTLQGQLDVEKIAKKHTLDWSDALQIQSILKGAYAALSVECSTILITADAGLAKAATEEGIRTWNILESDIPAWAVLGG